MDLFPLPGALVYSRNRAGTQKITGAGNEAGLEQTGNSSRARTAGSSMLQVPEKNCKLPSDSHPVTNELCRRCKNWVEEWMYQMVVLAFRAASAGWRNGPM